MTGRRSGGMGMSKAGARSGVVGLLAAVAAAVAVVPLFAVDTARPAPAARAAAQLEAAADGKLLFFAADGLRQDAVRRFANRGAAPGFRRLLRRGVRASGGGMRTQAPPNTGAGWFT